ncbi:MAG: hypothetical protein GYA21_15100 [Myxococcales bacterium]|nr:hypothetical protein [Myxococcales bacterium]
MRDPVILASCLLLCPGMNTLAQKTNCLPPCEASGSNVSGNGKSAVSSQGSILAFIIEAVRFAHRQTMKLSAPEGAIRLRAVVWPKVALGAIVGRVYHALKIPFEWTPLFALPWAFAGAWLLLAGHLWAGVLCSFLVVVFDIADGVATGFSVEPLPAHLRPRERMQLRRFLDSYVVDMLSHLLLYLVFALRLLEEGLVAVPWLGALLTIEVLNTLHANHDEAVSRKDEFFYEFVIDRKARRRFEPLYLARVFLSHLTAYHGYSLLPLLGYLAPLAAWGTTAFWLVFGYRAAALAARALRAFFRNRQAVGSHLH